MSGFFSEKNKLIFLFVLAVIFGLTLSFIFSQKIDPAALFIDSQAYKTTALNVINHHVFSYNNAPPYEPSGFRAPGYPLWLALIYLVFGSFKPAIFLGIFVFALTVPLIYLIARELFDKRIAFLAGILFALEPWGAFLSGAIMSEQIFLPAFVLAVYLFIRYLKQNSHKFLYLSAGLLGISALIRPNALYIWPVFAIFIFFKKNGFLKSLKTAGLASLIFLFVIAPWLIRNKVVLGTWQITTVQGFSLFVDNFNTFQVHRGKFKSLDEGYEIAYKLTKGFDIMSKEGTEILMRAALKGIKEDPYSYTKLSIFSMPSFFIRNSYSSLGYYLGAKEFKIQSQTLSLLKQRNFSAVWDKMRDFSAGEWILLLSGFFWPVIAILFLTGIFISLVKFKSNRSGILLILGVVFYFVSITTLMIELARFRIQAQPFIFMFAAAGIFYFSDYLYKKFTHG